MRSLGDQQHQQYPPPPPPGQYDGDQEGDDQGGALFATVDMVTTMFQRGGEAASQLVHRGREAATQLANTAAPPPPTQPPNATFPPPQPQLQQPQQPYPIQYETSMLTPVSQQPLLQTQPGPALHVPTLQQSPIVQHQLYPQTHAAPSAAQPSPVATTSPLAASKPLATTTAAPFLGMPLARTTSPRVAPELFRHSPPSNPSAEETHQPPAPKPAPAAPAPTPASHFSRPKPRKHLNLPTPGGRRITSASTTPKSTPTTTRKTYGGFRLPTPKIKTVVPVPVPTTEPEPVLQSAPAPARAPVVVEQPARVEEPEPMLEESVVEPTPVVDSAAVQPETKEETIPQSALPDSGSFLDTAPTEETTLDQPAREPPINDEQETNVEQPETVEEKQVETATEVAPDLPDGWTEQTDPSSGQQYYYNLTTGTTTWERPQTEETTTPAAKEAAVESTEREQTENESNTMEPPMPDSATAQFEAQVENELQIEPASAEALVETTDTTTPEEVARPVEKELPGGWSEMVDPSSGKTYYTNIATGESVWELPEVAVEPDSEVTNEEAKEPEDVQENDGEPELVASLEDNLEEPLPEGWTEEIDPSSGGTYFFNVTTGETSWERPPSTSSRDAVEPEVTEAGPGEREDNQNENEPEQVAPAPLDLLAGWTEEFDEASGRPYYYNAETGETTWERPTVEEQTEGEGVVAEADTANPVDETEPEQVAPAPLDLPVGWVEEFDEASGKNFYYNGETGETTWERPTEQTEAEDVATETDIVEGDAVDEPDMGETKPEQVVPDSTDLPPGWSEEFDEASGQNFYYNSETGETTWERPVVENQTEGEDVAEEDVAEADDPDTTIQVDESEPEQVALAPPSDLPPGWTEEFNEASGQNFYYNSETGETMWERPVVEDQTEDVAEEVVAEADEPDTTIQVDESEPEQVALPPPSDLPPGWTEEFDEASGQNFYYNSETGETTWERPVVEDQTEGEDAVAESDENFVESNGDENQAEESDTNQATESEPQQITPAPAPAALDLPAGWSEELDEPSGKAYYYNNETGETTWDKPITKPKEEEAEGVVAEAETAQVDEQDRNQVDEAEPEQVVPAPAPAPAPLDLPAGWSEEFDEASGKAYYYNNETGETTWERPTAEEQAETDEIAPEPDPMTEPETTKVDEPVTNQVDETEPEQVVPAPLDLPDGWTEEIDEVSGNTYYYNSVTGETTWERPVAEEPTKTGSEDSAVEAEVDEPVSAEQPNEAEPEPNASVSPGLPAAWSEEFDEASGKAFYYNAETGETTWERPAMKEQTNEENVASDTTADEGNNVEVDAVGVDEADTDQVDETEPEQVAPAPLDLPDGWSEEIDEASGRIYYYNRVTGQTTWERPIKEQTDIAEAEELTTEKDSEDRLEPDQSELLRDPKSTKTEGGSLSTETDGDAETNDDHPKEAAEAEGAEAPALGTKTAEEPEDILPPGWAKEIDVVSGRPYFFNKTTQESSWDIPSNDAPEATSENQEEKHEDDNVQRLDEAIEVKSQSTDLSSQWKEHFDSASGKPYYVNEATGESSWERPSSIASQTTPDQKSQEAEAHHPESELSEEKMLSSSEDNEDKPRAAEEISDKEAESMKSAEAQGPTTEQVLPEGWSQLVDEASGNVYYFNSDTGETTWDRPLAVVDDAGPANNQSTAEARKEENAENEMELMPVEPALNETQMPEEKPGSTGSASDGWEMMDHPASEKQTEVLAPTDEDAAGAVDDDAPVSEGGLGDEKSELPENWEAFVDEDSGRTYYYNSKENITSWDPPLAKAESTNSTTQDEVAGEESVQNESGTLQSDASKNLSDGLVAKDDALPEGWVEVVDSGSGDKYYFNEITNETTWDHPSAAEETAEQQDGAVSETLPGADTVVDEGDNVLPNGWVELKDPSSGKAYYYNEVENRTSWDRPSTGKIEPTVDDFAPSGKDRRLRPNHVFATFGFGGRMCIWRPKEKMIEVKKTHTVLESHHLISTNITKGAAQISGPLNEADEENVALYIGQRANGGSEVDLLWSLVQIAAENKGRLKSDYGVLGLSGPESSYIKLLLDNDSSDEPTEQYRSAASSGRGTSSLEAIETLLLHGKRDEALDEAVAAKDFAMALLIASRCGRKRFEETICNFAVQTLPPGTPLHTIAMFFSMQLDPPTECADVTSIWDNLDERSQHSWKKHLCAVVSNKIPGFHRLLFSLGDRLRELGNAEAAHFCYMVGGEKLRSLVEGPCRMNLVGIDHLVAMDAALMTDEGLEAFERTEAYEWAKRRGNPNAVIKSLQAFKLRYAMLLSDLGFGTAAELYVKTVRKGLSLEGGFSGFRETNPPPTVWAMSEDGSLETFLYELEDRLSFGKNPRHLPCSCVDSNRGPTLSRSVPSDRLLSEKSSGAGTLSGDVSSNDSEVRTPDTSATFVSARSTLPAISNLQEPRKLFNSSQSVPSQEDPVNLGKTTRAFTVPASLPEEKEESALSPVLQTDKAETLDASVSPTVPAKMPVAEKPVMLAASAPPMISTKVADLNKAPPMFNASASPAVSTKVAVADKPPSMKMSVPPTASAGPVNKVDKKADKDSGDKTEKPQESKVDNTTTKKPTPSPMSSPAKLEGNSGKATPSKSPGKSSWGFGIRDTMTKWLNPKATTADLGEGMQAYYDEKRKCWVFPGEDPDEKVKPIGPPPTAGAAKPAETEKKEDGPKDPLAAMMAPPTRVPSSLRRPGAGSGGAAARLPGVMMPPGAGPPMMMPPGAGPSMMMPPGPTPQFTMFKPKDSAGAGGASKDGKSDTTEEEK